MANVRLKNVTKIFDKNIISLNEVNINIPDREFMVLVGPSGCGKSTALRMIAGLEDITKGEIYIGDRLVNEVPPKDREVAMVFQNYALYPHMTVYQNMAFGLKLRKFAKKEIEKRVHEAAEMLEIKSLLIRKPKALSGGQRQRVAVGRAIVRKAQLYLFDEPLSNLDAKLRVQMRTELLKLHARLKSTMIYVTHDQMEAMTMGDRIAVMKDGCVKQIDPPLTLYNNPNNKFVAGFIGSPSMNFIAGKIIREEGHWFVNSNIRLPISNKGKLGKYIGSDVILGIRPGNMHYVEKNDRSGNLSQITAIVKFREMMGNEVLLHASVGEYSIVARLGPDFDIPIGKKVDLQLDIDKMHLFDCKTGLSICRNEDRKSD